MKAAHVHEMNLLAPEDGWSLLCKKATMNTEEERDVQDLKDTGMKIVEKCGGLPMAIKTIGAVLLRQRTQQKCVGGSYPQRRMVTDRASRRCARSTVSELSRPAGLSLSLCLVPQRLRVSRVCHRQIMDRRGVCGSTRRRHLGENRGAIL
ncbi:NB-ARC domain containing protein [Musa troglodytarum]|uniref:NB-ARC domain containing protein n=1 Tax=Musa troglodytarum TaxID=320322 RepID=A0A9E7JB41_9LILI|nr:NB-ARC domain containing protein [Musa troglodytarum]